MDEDESGNEAGSGPQPPPGPDWTPPPVPGPPPAQPSPQDWGPPPESPPPESPQQAQPPGVPPAGGPPQAPPPSQPPSWQPPPPPGPVAPAGPPPPSWPQQQQWGQNQWQTAMPAKPSTWKRGMPIPMRPMGVGEILDAAVNLYRLHWKTLMLIVAFVSVPMVFLQELATRNSVFMNPQQITYDPITGQPNFTPDQFLRPLLIIGVFTLIQYFLVRPFLTAATIHAVARGYLGDVPTVEGSYKFALSRLGSILWVILLQSFALIGAFLVPFLIAFSGQNNGGAIALSFVAFIAVAVFAVIVWIRWTFGTVAVVVEEQRGTKALGRSWRLSKDFAGKIFGALFVASLITGIVSAILAFIPSGIAQNAGSSGWLIRAIGGSLASIITTPFITIVIVLLYFDLRIRKEGLDLALMAQELQRSES